MTRSAAFFLILLRLAIGWHFLVEGFQKIPSEHLVALGLSVNNKPFSSAGYFREAPGPLGDAVRWLAGDPDSEALARLSALPVPEGEDPATYKPHLRVPPALQKEWAEYLRRFSQHHGLDDGQQSKSDASLTQGQARVVAFLTYVPEADPARREKDPHYAQFTSEQTRNYPSGEVKRRMTMGERIDEYRGKLAALRDASGRKLWLFGKDVEGARLRAAKAEITRLRTGLLTDLDRETQSFKDSLDKVLTREQQAQGPPPERKGRSIVDYIDLVTPWMLTIIGACLLVGLCSRLSAFLAAGFLLMTYLAMPSLPWLPVAGPTEGNYLFVNKNIVEMLALCVLMCLPTGRWFGADGILYAITGPFRRKKQPSA
jgi:uncharacterized membrane protein YphA (DoxX/SURF4 family)